MHPNISRFGFDGVINDDSDFIRLRAQYETLIVHQMRDDGYVPLLDHGPMFSTTKLEKGYEFVLTVYGQYVGKRKSWAIEGISGSGQQFPRYTAKGKSTRP
jgi:hypothetical protein